MQNPGKDEDFPWWLILLCGVGLWLFYEVLSNQIYAEVLEMEAAAGTVVKVPRILRRFESRFLRTSRGRT